MNPLFFQRLSKPTVAAVFTAAILGAQQSTPTHSPDATAAPPVVAKRQPPSGGTSTIRKQLAIPSATDLQQTMAILQTAGPGSVPDLQNLPNTPSPLGAAPVLSGGSQSALPKDFHPRHDVALPALGKVAVALNDAWVNSSDAPSMGKDGRVIYTYGSGLPLIVCEPLRITTIELQPGEKFTSEPEIADSVRWMSSPSVAGSGDAAQTLILLKPKYAGLDTNLVLTTDRRIYYLRLVSKPDEYLARVAFTYPDDQRSAEWRKYQADQKRYEEEHRQKEAVARTTQNETNITMGYRFKGPRTYFQPVSAYDDGTFTYIQLPDQVKNYGAPVLMIKGPNGLEPVAYDARGTTYVVHRLFYKAALVSGTGKHAKVVYIISPRGEIDHTSAKTKQGGAGTSQPGA
jgi:P-type conjugative transfer protein TrbG